MSEHELPITPATKVAALLEHYPQLEEVLIGMAPPFKKLKNPILRKSVAKVASLRQAAAVGRISIGEMVNKLRAAVGQEPLSSAAVGSTDSYFTAQPDWLDRTKIVTSLDERVDVTPDMMPLTALVAAAARLQPTEIVELVTTFLPAPGIDIMKAKGYLVWSEEKQPGLVRSYFSKPADS